MIKILHIIPSLRRGGAERLVLDICSKLSKRPDVKVSLICFSDQNEYPEYADTIKPIVIHSEIRLSLYRKNEFFVDELQTYVKKFEPDIIHTHLFESEIISRSIYYPDAKWFSHCHDNMVQFRNFEVGSFFSKTRVTNFFEKQYLFKRYVINGGNHFIANSRDTEVYFNKTASPYQVTLLSNAINYEKFYNHSKQKVPGDILRLVNIGSFVKNKNQSFLIDVAHLLKKQNIGFELHFAGDGPDLISVKVKAEKLALDEYVFFHGKIEKVEELLWNSHIYIHSAYSESFGLTLLEAMAVGLPVIALDGKGNRDIIMNGENGYLIEDYYPKIFAEKIIEIWRDKSKYDRMALFAQEFAKDYDIKFYVDKLLDLYFSKVETNFQ